MSSAKIIHNFGTLRATVKGNNIEFTYYDGSKTYTARPTIDSLFNEVITTKEELVAMLQARPQLTHTGAGASIRYVAGVTIALI